MEQFSRKNILKCKLTPKLMLKIFWYTQHLLNVRLCYPNCASALSYINQLKLSSLGHCLHLAYIKNCSPSNSFLSELSSYSFMIYKYLQSLAFKDIKQPDIYKLDNNNWFQNSRDCKSLICIYIRGVKMSNLLYSTKFIGKYFLESSAKTSMRPTGQYFTSTRRVRIEFQIWTEYDLVMLFYLPLTYRIHNLIDSVATLFQFPLNGIFLE
jgi:hypothetical protein